MKTTKFFTKTFLVVLTFVLISTTNNLQAQTPVGTWQVQDWFEEVFNSVGPDGRMANLHLYGSDRNKQQVRLVMMKDGSAPRPNKIEGIVLFVYLTEAQYTRAVDCLQRGKKVEFRWDGNSASGYLRQYKN